MNVNASFALKLFRYRVNGYDDHRYVDGNVHVQLVNVYEDANE